MKKIINVTVATLFALPVYAGVTTTNATPLMHTVVCADGTSFTVGDAIADNILCAEHGGVKPKSPGYGSKVKTNSGTPAVPLNAKRTNPRAPSRS
ncbi:MAG: hypothetical protein ABJN26_07390 [Stappiaceae bacterium]